MNEKDEPSASTSSKSVVRDSRTTSHSEPPSDDVRNDENAELEATARRGLEP